MDENNDDYIKIFNDRSEYVVKDKTEIYHEGKVSEEAKSRTLKIKAEFESGFLDKVIEDVRKNKAAVSTQAIHEETVQDVQNLVNSITSEAGRALVALTIMQLSIKAISPKQNTRLHKGNSNPGSFSWVDGISMRSLDKNYITPTLRKYNLIALNADGFMMTRSLAENYPYTKLYKARLRGAREHWLNIVELLENGEIDALDTLKYLISILLNRGTRFNVLASKLIEAVEDFLSQEKPVEKIAEIISSHVKKSDYAARLMEISMHSLMQAAVSTGAFGELELKPLSQMRSANKKHGNVGDIELLENREIIEAWDAKYGKNYLRDELDEISEKLNHHERIHTIGFVTTDQPVRNEEVNKKISDITELYDLDVKILSLNEWIDYVSDRVINSSSTTREELFAGWLIAYAESLAQKRRDIAPIDEPSLEWVELLTSIIEDM